MKQAAEHSLQLDDAIAESHLAIARLKMMYEWDFSAATIEYKKAIELNPNFSEAHVFYAICMCFLGNYTAAIKHASIAYRLDPFSSFINFNVANAYWMAGDYEKEVEYGRSMVEMEPDFYGGHYQIGRGLMHFNTLIRR
jgi:serine/threonine-protein kinase